MKVSRPALLQLLQQQMIYLSITAVVAAVFWAVGQQINPATILLYSLLLGNLVTLPMSALWNFYRSRSFPYNWLWFFIYLSLVFALAYPLATTVVWWLAPPSPQPLSQYLLTSWKFPVLVVVAYGSIHFIFVTAKKRLEQRNLELQRSVDAGSAQIAAQEQELQRAREIQQSLLPKDIPQIPGFEVAVAWKPARAVSGDYYDVFPLEKGKLCICIADVVGKGVSAALLMANTQAAVRALAGSSANPALLCEKVNRLLCENVATGKFVSFFCGVLDGDAHIFHYCNAGHPHPVLATNGYTRLLVDGGAVLGVFPEWKYQEEAVAIDRGDRLLLFTDGITEASPNGSDEFGQERVAEFVRTAMGDSARTITDRLLAEVSGFCDGRFQDDATLMTIAAR